MKIILSGPPRSGKTTLIRKLTQVSPAAFWVISEYTLDDGPNPTGYKATTSTGVTGVYTDTADPALIDQLFSTPISDAVSRGYTTIIIDEIGPVQRRSPQFVAAVDSAMDSGATILASVADGQDPYTGRSDVINLTLSTENRDELIGALDALLASTRMYQSLPPQQQAKVYELARNYAAAGAISPFRKLFQNTLIYIAEARYLEVSAGLYSVRGLTRGHEVSVKDGVWSCDCDLANGRGKYTGQPGDCSHIQTIKVIQA